MRLSFSVFFAGPATTATAVALGILLVGGGRLAVDGLRLSFAGGGLPPAGGGGLTAADGFWVCPPDSTFAEEDGLTVAGFSPIAKTRWPITEESFRSNPCPAICIIHHRSIIHYGGHQFGEPIVSFYRPFREYGCYPVYKPDGWFLLSASYRNPAAVRPF